MFKPFPRQQEAIDKMMDFVNSKTTKKGIFVYPTSAGKSVIIANVASKFPKKYFINVTTSKELVSQNFQKFISYGYEADLCSASLNENNVGKITYATIGTLKKHLDFFKDKEVVILSDECHVGSKKGSQLDKFINGIKDCKVIGTTATPLRLKQTMGGTELRMMNRDRDCFYSSIEDVMQIYEIVEDKKWSKLIYEVENIDDSYLQLNTTGTDYTLKSLKLFSENNDIVSKCISACEKLIGEGRKSILIFVPFIEDARFIESRLECCRSVYSGMDNKERDEVVNAFKDLSIKVVSQVNILSYGFDHPLLDAIVFARPTNSITLWYQGLGRGVRTHNDKKDCKIVDISGNFNKFGRIEDITFENHKWCGGWAAFSGDRLLTDYPLNSKVVPTKQSLQAAYERKQKKEDPLNPMFNFGMYKGKYLMDLLNDKTFDQKTQQTVKQRVTSYIHWIVEENKKGGFNFYGDAGEKLKKGIYEYLKLPVPETKKKERQFEMPF